MSKRTAIITLTLLVVFSLGGFSEGALVRHWPLDGDGTELVVANNGNLVNGPVPATDRFGNPNAALFLNGGSQQRVEVPGGGGLNNLQQGTISMFVNWTGIQDAACCGGTAGNVLGRQSNGAFSNNVIGLSNTNPASGAVTWQAYNAGAPIITGATPVADSTWRHVAVTFASGNHTLYIDGNIDGVSGAAGTINNNAAIPLAIGAWIGDGNGYSTSIIDDVKVFDNVLNQAEIQALAAPPTSAVPEPSTFGLAVIGLTAIAFVTSRRRRNPEVHRFTQRRAPMIMRPTLSKLAIVLVAITALLIGTSSVQAQTIPGVTIEDVSSELIGGGGPFNRVANFLLDGSGLTGNQHGVVPDGTMWLTSGTSGCCGGTPPLEPNGADRGVVTFDLGANYDLNFMHVWNYNEIPAFNSRGADLVEILTADTDVAPVFTSLGALNFAQAPGAGTYTGQTLPLVDNDVRLVRFNILSSHGGDNGFVGLSEVRFDGGPAAAAVPEPSSFGLAVFALAMLGLAARRRRRNA